jgi:phosphoribosylformylglycinamidine cyclo-ligase
MGRYQDRGVSSQKEDVHKAIKHVDKGLFPGAFCKIIEDVLGGDPAFCNIMHADGAGTKSSLAYLYWKETGDISVFRGIVMDAIVMNIDDLLCVGAEGGFLVSSVIDRNSKYIPGEVIAELINAFEEIIERYNSWGISMKSTGGETADVGDTVQTLTYNTTVTVRMPRKRVIDMRGVTPGLDIVALSSAGRASWEDEYNSGIGSNGLTSARHELFHSEYRERYPETYNRLVDPELIYCGPWKLTDTHPDMPITIGKAALSPTRTYAPVIKNILMQHRNDVKGMVHCTGGGQSKCLHFGSSIHYIKDNMMPLPPIFSMIREASGTEWREMYQVFNMGQRMELFVEPAASNDIISIAAESGIEASIIGRTDQSAGPKNVLDITDPEGTIHHYER